MSSIEDFLNSEFEQFYGSGDKSFRAWFRGCLVDVLEAKRAPGCDSDWLWHFYPALSAIDPEIVDPKLLDQRRAAVAVDDWETADEISEQIMDALDDEKAHKAFHQVVDYILAPR